MARLIRHDATGPIEVKPQAQSAWICACGLTQNLPFCDGSHKKSKSEKPGEVPVYDNARQNVVRVEKEA